MAKKNSTKTATKEARQASEPRLVQLKGWKGINLQQKPLGWGVADVTREENETMMPSNFLMVQNNINTTSDGCLESRFRTLGIASKPCIQDDNDPTVFSEINASFTGIEYLYGRFLFCAFSDGSLWVYDLLYTSVDNLMLDKHTEPYVKDSTLYQGWQRIYLRRKTESGKDEDDTSVVTWTHLRVISIGTVLHLLAFGTVNNKSVAYLGDYGYDGSIKDFTPNVVKAWQLHDPSQQYESDNETSSQSAFSFSYIGNIHTKPDSDSEEELEASIIRFYYAYTNEWGSTNVCQVKRIAEIYTAMIEWDSANCMAFKGKVPEDVSNYWYMIKSKIEGSSIDQYIYKCAVTGIDIYMSVGDNTNTAFLAHAEVANDGTWSIPQWLGAYNDTSDWSDYNSMAPETNTSGGIDACFSTQIDGRNYFWGSPTSPERLYIGGNAPNELCIARGLGGAYIDIEPGIGTVIKAVHKFKTQSGSSIVTILCANKNTGRTKRYNLIETNITITSALSEQSFMVEEVSNVIGCNSFWGSGVWLDGMYTLGRYGLTVTTQQMEYSSQLRSVLVSNPIAPIFTDRLGEQLENARVICIGNVLYLVLAEGEGKLDQIIFCYDTDTKAWWTYSVPLPEGENILHIFSIDFHKYVEGIGIITPSRILIIPTAGYCEDEDLYRINDNTYSVYMETGEIGATVPPQSLVHLTQIEFKFDYLIGFLDIEFDAIDYFGRHAHVHKTINSSRVRNNITDWMRIDYQLFSFNLRIKGNAHFKLTSIFLKEYNNSRKINLIEGFDSTSQYSDRRGRTTYQHHSVKDYTTLKDCVIGFPIIDAIIKGDWKIPDKYIEPRTHWEHPDDKDDKGTLEWDPPDKDDWEYTLP